MNKSLTISKIAAALLKVQTEVEHARKGSKNPFFKSNYADLTEVISTVKEPLNKNGISFLQIVDRDPDGSAVVETTLLHESGEFISGRTPVFTAKPNDPQALGSGITYSKRYGLQAICGIATEDDDGEAAMARAPRKPKAGELEDLIKKLKKTDTDIVKMRKFVGAGDGTGVSDLDDTQKSKLITILRKQL